MWEEVQLGHFSAREHFVSSESEHPCTRARVTLTLRGTLTLTLTLRGIGLHERNVPTIRSPLVSWAFSIFSLMRSFSLRSFPATAVSSDCQILEDSEAFRTGDMSIRFGNSQPTAFKRCQHLRSALLCWKKVFKLFSKPCWIRYWSVCGASPRHTGSVLNILIFKRDRVL